MDSLRAFIYFEALSCYFWKTNKHQKVHPKPIELKYLEYNWCHLGLWIYADLIVDAEMKDPVFEAILGRTEKLQTLW